MLTALPHAQLKEVAAVLWGMSVLGAQPCRALVQGMDARIMFILQHVPDGISHAVRIEEQANRAAMETPTLAAVLTAAAEQEEHDEDGSEAAQLRQWRGLLGTVPASSVVVNAAGAARPSAAVAAQLLWSVAWLPESQGFAAWADDLLTAILPTLGSATQQTLLVLLRSLAWLRHTPGDLWWMDVWWRAYVTHLHIPHQAALRTAQQPTNCSTESPESERLSAVTGRRCQRPASSSVVGGTACMPQPCSVHHAHSPGQEPSTGHHLTSTQAERLCFQLTVVMWCFRRLQMQPSSSTGWLHTCLDISQPLLRQLSAKRFSLLLSQMALLHVWPGERWLSSAEEALLQHMHAGVPPLQLQQLTANLRTLGSMQQVPTRQ